MNFTAQILNLDI